MEKEIESAKKRLKKKYNFEFPVPIIIGDGIGGSVGPEGIKIGRDNPLELIEVKVIHEAYHIIFGIDQTESFKEKDKGNIMPYYEEEMWIWNKIKEDFPELSIPVYSCIQEQTLFIQNFRKKWNSV